MCYRCSRWVEIEEWWDRRTERITGHIVVLVRVVGLLCPNQRVSHQFCMRFIALYMPLFPPAMVQPPLLLLPIPPRSSTISVGCSWHHSRRAIMLFFPDPIPIRGCPVVPVAFVQWRRPLMSPDKRDKFVQFANHSVVKFNLIPHYKFHSGRRHQSRVLLHLQYF